MVNMAVNGLCEPSFLSGGSHQQPMFSLEDTNIKDCILFPSYGTVLQNCALTSGGLLLCVRVFVCECVCERESAKQHCQCSKLVPYKFLTTSFVSSGDIA